MAVTRGCRARVYAGPTPTRVFENTDISIQETAERIDASEAGDCTKKFEAGAVEQIATITFWDNSLAGTDPAPDAGQALLITGNAVDFEIRPNGDGAGRPQMAFNGTITQKNRAMNGVNGLWSLQVEAAVNGSIDETAQT